jgi:ATP-dependent Clp protease ATP-binding subunit ClpA
VDEPTIQDTIEILRGIKCKYEEFHNVRYNKGVLTEMVNLCNRYLTDKRFPDKAIDILDEVGARVKIERYKTQQIEEV